MKKIILITTVILLNYVSSYAIKTMDEIIIESTRIPMPLSSVGSSVEIITSEDLQNSGSHFLYDALKTLPGIYGTENGGPGGTAQIYLRGGKPRYTLILLDGVRLNDSQDSNGYDLSAFDISGIERIEILKGAQSSLYGADALSGVINIITKKGSASPSMGLNLERGSFGTSKTTINLNEGTDSFYFNLDANRFSNDGFSSKNSAGSDPDDDGFLNNTLGIGVGGRVLSGSEWNVGTRIISADGEFDDGTYGKNQFIGSVSFKQNLLDNKFTSEIKSSYRLFKLLYGSGYNSRTEALGFEWNGILQVNDQVRILSGVENNREDFGDDYDLEVTSYFLGSQYIINKDINVSLSTRRDIHTIFNTANTYQGSFSLFNSMNTKIRGSVGTSYLAPNGWQMSRNDHLEAEKGTSYEIGIDHKFENLDLDVDLTLFKNSFKQAIDYIQDTDSYTNYSNAQISGIEIGGNLYPSDTSNLRLSYTYLDSDADEENIGFINRKPKHKINARYQLNPNDKLSITSFFSYVDETTDKDWDADATVTLDDYSLISMNARYKINAFTEYYVSLINILDEEYETVKNYNTPDFSIYSGVRLSF